MPAYSNSANPDPHNEIEAQPSQNWVVELQRSGVSPSAILALQNMQISNHPNFENELNFARRTFTPRSNNTWAGRGIVAASSHRDMAMQEIGIQSMQYNTLQPEASITESKITKKDIIELDNARQRLINEAPRRHDIGGGSKEIQWRNTMRDKKRMEMPFDELIASETPIFAEHVPYEKISAYLTLHGRQPRCYTCGRDVGNKYTMFCIGNVYCTVHVPNLMLCASCNSLKEGCKVVGTYDNKQAVICTGCFKRNASCSACGKEVGAIYRSNGLCTRCIDLNPHANHGRGPSQTLKWISEKVGNVVKSNRIFSSELEAVTPAREWTSILQAKMPQAIGFTTDGSVEGHKVYGFEVQTPRLGGSLGEELVHRVASTIRAMGSSVNQTCGMHIHLDGKGLLPIDRREYPDSLIQLWKTYIIYENIILSLLPFSRRRNDYCRPLSEAFKIVELDILDSLIDAEKLWYTEKTFSKVMTAKGHHYHSARYFGVNFSPLFASGHFEIRLHSGTLNSKKILEWANLHALITDAAVAGKLGNSFLNESQATPNMRDKTIMLFDRIGLSAASQQYFFARQKKFGNKKEGDEEVESKNTKEESTGLASDTFNGFDRMMNSQIGYPPIISSTDAVRIIDEVERVENIPFPTDLDDNDEDQ